jgi:hypothetical protein
MLCLRQQLLGEMEEAQEKGMKNKAAGKRLATLRDEIKEVHAALNAKLAEWKKGRDKRDALIDEAGKSKGENGDSSWCGGYDDWSSVKPQRELERATSQQIAMQQQAAASAVAAYPEQPVTLAQQLTLAGRRTVIRYRLEVVLHRAQKLVNTAMFVDQVSGVPW